MRLWPTGFRSRIAREKQTIKAMVVIYCRGHHRSRPLCEECQDLLRYASCRLDLCPFGESKTTCANCAVHCYRPAMRERIRNVMRYAGPRMLLRHPALAAMHLIDGRLERVADSPPPPGGSP